jgi:perosamine synthetase
MLDAEEADAAYQAVRSGWVSQGPQVAAFECEFAAFVGAQHACAVSNCTTALHLALAGVGVGPGDEVITASHSFIATANCIRYCGATPVFVDIIPETYNLDPNEVAAAITDRTRAILVVHQMGMPCDLAALAALANKHNLALIEDAACAAGSEIHIDGQWERIGKTRGAVACFSFHPRKVITTGEGGMLTTNDPEIDRKFRLLRQHGMSVPDTVRHGSAQVIFEDYLTVGFNYRMTDIQAAIGRRQLERLPALVSRRRLLASRYAELLGNVEELQLPLEPAWARSNWQSYCV